MTKYLALFILGCFMMLIGVNLPALPQYPAIEWGAFYIGDDRRLLLCTGVIGFPE